MQLIDWCVALTFGQVELTPLVSVNLAGVWNDRLSRRRRRAGKLGEKLESPGADQRAKVLVRMVGEEEERARGGELLSLEEQRCAWPKQQQGGHCPKPPGTG